MARRTIAPVLAHDFSQAFGQVCSVVAIADSRSAHDTLDQLILQCFVILDDRFTSADQLREAIEVLFGLRIRVQQIEERVAHLLDTGQLQRPLGAEFMLSEQVQADIRRRIDEARALEDRVRQVWAEELASRWPDLSASEMWTLLQGYLARAFRRHGILTAALLDPTLDQSGLAPASLISLLDDAVSEVLPEARRDAVKQAIGEFLAGVATHQDRAKYIAQLANGAFSYFALAVAPDVSERLRQHLSTLELFLDTNFLFGILNLSDNPLTEISHELLRDIERHHLPFDLRVHEATLGELRRTIDYYGDRLRSTRWTPALSRAALSIEGINGIERRYHEANARHSIDVDTFLRPYAHLDVVLQEWNITAYSPDSERLDERADLFADYQAFLRAKRGSEKFYNPADHDVTVLDTVHQLRKVAPSSLDSGAMLLTCDYALHAFDVSLSRHPNRPCTVLPNVLWQVLRPFVPAGPDFERSFAETFAIPEFRTLDNDVSRSEVSRRALYLLSSFSNIGEQTATRLLTNDLFLDKLQASGDDAEAREQVELAIARDNEMLLEERAELEQQIERQRREQANLQARELQRQAGMQTALQEEQRQREELSAALEAEKELAVHTQEQLHQVECQRDAEQQRAAGVLAGIQRDNAAKERDVEAAHAEIAQLRERQTGLIAALACVASVGGFEWLVHAMDWIWLLSHPNSLALQAGIDALLVCGILMWLYPSWRKGLLIPLILAMIPMFIGLLGR